MRCFHGEMSTKKLKTTDYSVAWLAPVADLELLPSCLMLDEEHATPEYDTKYDENIYTCGSMAGHNVVIATCPPGLTGNVNAGEVSGPMFKTFSAIRMAVLVGIGGGMPGSEPSDDPTQNVHLGDVVVGWPGDGGPACLYHDAGRFHTKGRFEMMNVIDRPDRVLLKALGQLMLDHERDRNTFHQHRQRLLESKHRQKFTFPGLEHDRLFEAAYRHPGQYNDHCVKCDGTKLVGRPRRSPGDAGTLIFHRGRIATGSAVIQDGVRREAIRKRCNGALCVETEAAGVDVSRTCLVIRGISDYADSHKSDMWRSYAAGNAVVFARELLGKVPPAKVSSIDLRVSYMPYGRNPKFTGREAQLDKLRDMLFVRQDRLVALSGLGGMGKTQLALELAYRVRNNTLESIPEQCSVFWMPAQTMAAFHQAAMELVQKLVEELGIKHGEGDDAKETVRRYLDSEAAGAWLLILDNLDDVTILSRERDQASSLSNFLPRSEMGRVLITTRSSKVAVEARADAELPLGAMCFDEAKTMLETALFDKTKLKCEEEIERLLEKLTYLPLTIAQAAAYINQTKVPIAEYLRLLESTDQNMISLLRKKLSDEMHHSEMQGAVVTTWIVTFEAICRESASAARLLSFIQCVDYKAIPRAMLPASESEVDLADAIGIICGYGFMSWRGDSKVLDMHRLVHLALRMWPKSTQAGLMTNEDVVGHLLGIFPPADWENRVVWRQYLPHVLALMKKAASTQGGRFASIGHRAGACLLIDGRTREGAEMLEHVVAMKEKTLAEDHPSRLASLHELAAAYQANGQVKDAVKMMEHVVAVREKTQAGDHPHRLAAQYMLAAAYQANGQVKDAVKMLEHVVAMEEKTLAEDHPHRLASQQSLAAAYQANGQVKDAVKMLEHVVAMEKTLTEDHPHRLASQQSLAAAYQANGQVKDAVKMLEHVVAVREKTLAGDHPHRLASKHALAGAYEASGQVKDAVKMLEHVVAIEEKTLAGDHPHRLASQHALAIAYEANGQVKDAVKMLEHVVAMEEKTLVEDHPHRLASQQSLAGAYEANGQVKDAVKMLDNALAHVCEALDRDLY